MPEIIIESTQANNRIRMIGSSNFSKNCFHKDVFAGGVNMLEPYFRLFSSTSAEVRPFNAGPFAINL